MVRSNADTPPVGGVVDMAARRSGYGAHMGVINRIVSAILTLVSAPFRALAALFGGRGRHRT
jgi:hypothetical protein